MLPSTESSVNLSRAFTVKVVPKRLLVFPLIRFVPPFSKRCVLWPLQPFKSPENGEKGSRFGTTFTANALRGGRVGGNKCVSPLSAPLLTQLSSDDVFQETSHLPDRAVEPEQ